MIRAHSTVLTMINAIYSKCLCDAAVRSRSAQPIPNFFISPMIRSMSLLSLSSELEACAYYIVCHANLCSWSDIYRNNHSTHHRIPFSFVCLLHAGAFSLLHVTDSLFELTHMCQQHYIYTIFDFDTFSFSF